MNEKVNFERLVWFLLVVLAVLAGLSFWVNPSYEKGVWFVIGLLGGNLSNVIGAVLGLAQPNKAGEETKDKP